MIAAALISCALLVAVFLHQHLTNGRNGQASAHPVRATPAKAQARPATLYRDAAPTRTDWTKLEAYDPLPLHEFDWSEPRSARDGRAAG